MQIDWLTVAAQIVNFLVLVWLLQRFLYAPITRAMERREQRIKGRLDEADQKRQEAENEAQAYREKQVALEQERDRILADAREAAGEERKALEQEARNDVAARKQAWLEQLDAQRDTFLSELRQRTTEQFYALARRALADLADSDLEEKIALGFVRQMESLDKSTQEKIANGYAKADHTARIRSRFDLSANAKRLITKTIHERFGKGVRTEYEMDDNVACGIELKAGSQTVTWSLASYLDGFESAVDEQLSRVLASTEGRKNE